MSLSPRRHQPLQPRSHRPPAPVGCCSASPLATQLGLVIWILFGETLIEAWAVLSTRDGSSSKGLVEPAEAGGLAGAVVSLLLSVFRRAIARRRDRRVDLLQGNTEHRPRILIATSQPRRRCRGRVRNLALGCS